MAGQRETRSKDAPRSTEEIVSWWVGLSREAMQAALAKHVFNTAKARFVRPDQGNDEDPGYSFTHARTAVAHRKQVGFAYKGGGGVELIRDDLHEPLYNSNPAPIEYTDTVRRIEASREYREWVANRHYPNQMHRAYEAAAVIIVHQRFGIHPEWSPDQQSEFERWCFDHEQQVQEAVELIE